MKFVWILSVHYTTTAVHVCDGGTGGTSVATIDVSAVADDAGVAESFEELISVTVDLF